MGDGTIPVNQLIRLTSQGQARCSFLRGQKPLEESNRAPTLRVRKYGIATLYIKGKYPQWPNCLNLRIESLKFFPPHPELNNRALGGK